MPRRRQPPRKLRARFIEAVAALRPDLFVDLRRSAVAIAATRSWGFSPEAERWAKRSRLRCGVSPFWTALFAEEEARQLVADPTRACPDIELLSQFGPASPRKDDEHFEWLARYQVGRESFHAIARTAGREAESVREAVHKLAALLTLTLRRPNPGGRPPSVRN